MSRDCSTTVIRSTAASAAVAFVRMRFTPRSEKTAVSGQNLAHPAVHRTDTTEVLSRRFRVMRPYPAQRCHGTPRTDRRASPHRVTSATRMKANLRANLACCLQGSGRAVEQAGVACLPQAAWRHPHVMKVFDNYKRPLRKASSLHSCRQDQACSRSADVPARRRECAAPPARPQ